MSIYSSDSTASPAEEASSDTDIILTTESLKQVEQHLNSYDKVAIAFLYLDFDNDVSLKACEKCIKEKDKPILKAFISRYQTENWSMKLLECLFRVKNYYALEEHGLSKHDAAKQFNERSFLKKERILFYDICESLKEAEKEQVMNCLPSLQKEYYMEVWLLKVFINGHWEKVESFLMNFPHEKVLSLMKQLNTCFSPPVKKSVPSLDLGSDLNNLSSEDDYYKIKNPESVGLCLIINNRRFQIQPERLGSEKDVELLETTMKSFNFDVITIHNCPGEKFAQNLYLWVSKSFKEAYSIFMLVLLSHGGNGYILGTDENEVSIEQHVLAPLAHVEKLNSIPKLILIQACQGEKYLQGSITTDCVESVCEPDDDNFTQKQSHPAIGSYITDAFIALSSVPGFKAYRDITEGSWFIQHFCRCLTMFPYCDIQEIMTKVIKKVSQARLNTKVKNLVLSQCPLSNSNLQKKLYLKRKYSSTN